MKQIGRLQKLEILRFTGVGAYLNDVDETSDTDVLLPSKYLTDDMALGDFIDVFLYRDSEDRLIATTDKPALALGGIGKLDVVSTTQHGAFLDWGLPKDLFLPFKEQSYSIKCGDQVVVYVYLDKADRLTASMRIEQFLTTDHQLTVAEWVGGTAYRYNPHIGLFVAVNDQYYGLLPVKDCFKDYRAGESVELRIASIHPDGKLVLSAKAERGVQIHDDVAVLLKAMTVGHGQLALHDKSSPDEIRQRLGMSKKAFKRAVGVLLKDGRITMDDRGIKTVSQGGE